MDAATLDTLIRLTDATFVIDVALIALVAIVLKLLRGW